MSKQEIDDWPTEEKSLANSSSMGNGKSIRILLVEDEFLTAVNIKEDLELFGYEVPAIVTNGEEAIRKALELLPDLILMDISLDGPMSGIEAATEIQKSHPIPIIYLTAHADAKTIEQAKTTAPFGYLSKPCSAATMMSTIEMVYAKNKNDLTIQRRERQTFAAELSKKAVKLQEANTALKVLLEQREEERSEVEQTIRSNVTRLILPSLRALESSLLNENQHILAEAIRINLQLLTKAHVSQFGGNITRLSDTEMQVANFVRAGKSTKEIALFLNLASSTINTHRDSIRKKLGLKNTKTNLQKALQQMP